MCSAENKLWKSRTDSSGHRETFKDASGDSRQEMTVGHWWGRSRKQEESGFWIDFKTRANSISLWIKCGVWGKRESGMTPRFWAKTTRKVELSLAKSECQWCQRSGCLDQVMGGIRMFGSFNFFTRHSRDVKAGEDKKDYWPRASKRSKHLETTWEFRDLQRMDQELQRITLKVFWE